MIFHEHYILISLHKKNTKKKKKKKKAGQLLIKKNNILLIRKRDRTVEKVFVLFCSREGCYVRVVAFFRECCVVRNYRHRENVNI